jgi:putative Mn2+ efflux pump MntP
MLSALTGFFFGLIHVFSGPDHLSAIAPIAIKHPRRAWFTGAQWGLGHSAGVFFVGLLALFFRKLLPMESISSWSERFVGVLLIGIGLWGVRKAFSQKLHTHEHAHEGHKHLHIHLHSFRETEHKHGAHSHNHAAFGIGTLHGLAGSSHLLSVLPAFALRTEAEIITYLLAFGLGTVAAMAAFSSGIGFCAQRVGTFKGYRNLMGASSVLTLLVGIFWLVF